MCLSKGNRLKYRLRSQTTLGEFRPSLCLSFFTCKMKINISYLLKNRVDMLQLQLLPGRRSYDTAQNRKLPEPRGHCLGQKS